MKKPLIIRSLKALVVLLLLVFFSDFSSAQNLNQPKFMFKSGIGIMSPDSSVSLNIRFRMQSRFLMQTNSIEDLSPAGWEARVRRTRLVFTGHAYIPELTYYLQLSFSRGDMDWSMSEESSNNTSPNVVRDAMIFYSPNKNLRLGLGQTKLPGNRQRVISSGSQQFFDRSPVNANLTLDRDFGFFATYSLPTGKVLTLFKTAITSGEGRNSVASNSGLAYTGRVEVLPFGAFTDGGDYFEGDLAREPKPKLSIGAVYHFNDLAVRTQGELGKDLYGAKSFEAFIVDALFKYRGWALSSEYLQKRTTGDAITKDLTNKERALLLGSGYNAQLSYCTAKHWEVAGRYAYLQPDNKVLAHYSAIEQYGMGLTKYFMHHKVKAQFNLMYNRETNMVTHVNKVENIWAVFQMEFGI